MMGEKSSTRLKTPLRMRWLERSADDSGAFLQPSHHLWRFVGGTVVEHQMDLQARRHGAFDLIKEAHELLPAMLALAATDDFAGGGVQGSK
jgi:hypothetical protein